MSITYDCATYIIPNTFVPEKFTTCADLDAFLKGHPCHLWGATRMGWMHWVLQDILIGRGLKALAFMGLKSGDQKFDRIDADMYPDEPDQPYVYTYVTLVSGARLAQVIDDIDTLIDLARNQDAVTIKHLLDHDAPEDIVAATNDVTVHDGPRIEVGDEGQGSAYFFAFLRTFKRRCETALQEQCTVIYVLDEPA
jgi:hypothetical protein